MPFDLEWSGRSAGNEADHERAIDAAKGYCNLHEIDPAAAWAENSQSIEEHSAMSDTWAAIEWAALQSLAQDWQDVPENVSLIWN